MYTLPCEFFYFSQFFLHLLFHVVAARKELNSERRSFILMVSTNEHILQILRCVRHSRL